jgi:hypothetical protein
MTRKIASVLKTLGNPEHTDFVKLGRVAIRAWGKEHPGSSLDLRGADLRGINLAGTDLSGTQFGAARPDERPASLRDAVLRKARLRRVFLRMADLRGADLRDADFRGSQLSIADFSFADLTGANLRDCIFIATDFNGATLDRADLTHSIVGHTRFTALDLSEAKGLAALQHQYPSTIDIDTLLKSSEFSPRPFLQGCGVPDALITNLRAFAGSLEPIQLNSCFISFSSLDKAFAEKLYSRLRDKHAPVWFAPEDMQVGRKIYDQVDRAIQSHDRLLLILSKHSMQSDWVLTEIRRALAAETKEKQKLFPIRLCDMKSLRKWTCFDGDSGKDMAVRVREYFIADFSKWKNHDAFEKEFERLLRDLSSSAPQEKRR